MPPPIGLSSPTSLTRWPIIQEVRGYLPSRLGGREGGPPLFVCIRFQSLFHSLVRVLFSFPSRYFSTIGQNRFFRLRGWSPFLPTRSFLVVLTFFIHSSTKGWRGYRAFTFSGVVSFILLHPPMTPVLVLTSKRGKYEGGVSLLESFVSINPFCWKMIGLLRVHSPLLTESLLIFFF